MIEKSLLMSRAQEIAIGALCIAIALVLGGMLLTAHAGDMVDVNNVTYKVARLTYGPVTVDCVTGNVTIKEGAKLDAASKAFWQGVEDRFKNNAKIAMRIKAWDELRVEAEGKDRE